MLSPSELADSTAPTPQPGVGEVPAARNLGRTWFCWGLRRVNPLFSCPVQRGKVQFHTAVCPVEGSEVLGTAHGSGPVPSAATALEAGQSHEMLGRGAC